MLQHRFLQKALLGGIAPLLLSGMLMTVVTPANALDAVYAKFCSVQSSIGSGSLSGLRLRQRT